MLQVFKLARMPLFLLATVCFLIPHSSFAASPLCSKLFESLSPLESFDSSANRKFYYNYNHKNPKNKKLLDAATMGVLGKLKFFEWDSVKQKIILKDDPIAATSVRTKTQAVLAIHPSKAPAQIIDLVKSSVEFTELSPSTVMITARLVRPDLLQSDFQKAILNRFQRAGMSTVDFVYRYSGLEAKKSLTGFTMLDEITQIMKEGRGFNFHLVYEKRIWEKELQTIAARFLQYNQAQSLVEKNEILKLIVNSDEPFLPTTGVVTTEVFYNSNKPVELKRYFQNPFPDPLAFTNTVEQNNFQLRHQMLYQVIYNLPLHTTVEIHAHSVVHMKAYLKLGFTLHEKTNNPLYPGVDVHVLRGNRETVIEKIRLILSKTEANE